MTPQRSPERPIDPGVRVGHVHLRTADIDRIRDFYVGVLGFEVVQEFRGVPGWFNTRSYHLYQLPLFSRKLRVVVDWTTSLFFRRDIAELTGLRDPNRLEG